MDPGAQEGQINMNMDSDTMFRCEKKPTAATMAHRTHTQQA